MEDQSLVNALLPRDCFNELVPHMRLQDLFKFSQVCKAFHMIVSDVFDFKTIKNVTTLTLTPKPFVYPSWISNCQCANTSVIGQHEVLFSDRALSVSHYWQCNSYCIYCNDLFISVSDSADRIMVYVPGSGRIMIRLGRDSNGKWILRTDKCRVSRCDNYEEMLPAIAECVEELQAWVNYWKGRK